MCMILLFNATVVSILSVLDDGHALARLPQINNYASDSDSARDHK